MMTRRDLLKAAVLGSAASLAPAALLSGRSARAADATAATPTATPGAPAAATTPTGPFVLPPLPYDYSALEPYIDEHTMHLHHDKHHATYVKNLNNAVTDLPGLALSSPEDLFKRLDKMPDAVRNIVRNNLGGHYNHSLFWQMMKKGGGGEPTGDLAKAVDKAFGSHTAFQDSFTKSALKVFGSGWAWLTIDAAGALLIENTPNQDSPIALGRTPLLGLDVWEHAYYLKYENRRAEYIAAWFNVVNWDYVSGRFNDANLKK
jgi:Fe-Mn family superoxide dismutase